MQASFRLESRFSAELCRLENEAGQCLLLMPNTFMNESGRAVSSVAHYFRIQPEEILVAHDELDLEPGVMRFKQAGGHAGHNGLRDIIAALASKQFQRLRIGVGHPGQKDQVVNYVLGDPPKAEYELIKQGMDNVLSEREVMFNGDYQKLMRSLH